MSSARELLAEGHAKRADLLKVAATHIHVEPGFNVPETKEEWEARVTAMVNHLANGGVLPAVETRPRDKGGQWLVDGHARLEAHLRAFKKKLIPGDAKDGKLYLLTVPFTGNDADRVLRTVTSALHNRVLSPLQLSDRYKRLLAFGWKPAEIAKKVGKTDEHVRNMLKVAEADTAAQKMIADGKVSATEVVKAIKKHGEGATAVLQEAVKKAGPKKVTAKTLGSGKTEKQQALEMDATLFRWLEENAEIDTDLIGRVQITLKVEIDGVFSGVRDLVQAGLVATEGGAA